MNKFFYESNVHPSGDQMVNVIYKNGNDVTNIKAGLVKWSIVDQWELADDQPGTGDIDFRESIPLQPKFAKKCPHPGKNIIPKGITSTSIVDVQFTDGTELIEQYASEFDWTKALFWQLHDYTADQTGLKFSRTSPMSGPLTQIVGGEPLYSKSIDIEFSTIDGLHVDENIRYDTIKSWENIKSWQFSKNSTDPDFQVYPPQNTTGTGTWYVPPASEESKPVIKFAKDFIAESEPTITNTLNELGSRYGDFHDRAKCAQALQDVMRHHMNSKGVTGWERLSPVQKQALTVIADKIARILNVDPNYIDNWHDIQGYAALVEKDISKH